MTQAKLPTGTLKQARFSHLKCMIGGIKGNIEESTENMIHPCSCLNLMKGETRTVENSPDKNKVSALFSDVQRKPDLPRMASLGSRG